MCGGAESALDIGLTNQLINSFYSMTSATERQCCAEGHKRAGGGLLLLHNPFTAAEQTLVLDQISGAEQFDARRFLFNTYGRGLIFRGSGIVLNRPPRVWQSHGSVRLSTHGDRWLIPTAAVMSLGLMPSRFGAFGFQASEST